MRRSEWVGAVLMAAGLVMIVATVVLFFVAMWWWALRGMSADVAMAWFWSLLVLPVIGFALTQIGLQLGEKDETP